MDGSSKKEKGFMDMDNSVVISEERGTISRINSNGKNTKKIKKKINL